MRENQKLRDGHEAKSPITAHPENRNGQNSRSARKIWRQRNADAMKSFRACCCGSIFRSGAFYSVANAALPRARCLDIEIGQAPPWRRRRFLVANANSRPSPYALVVVPNRFPPSPIATGWRNDIDRRRGVIARLCNGSAKQGSCRKAADNAGSNLPIFRSGWLWPSGQSSCTNRQ